MNCEELMKMPELNGGLQLVAGKAGIRRMIRWIYFADSVQCIDPGENPADFIHGGELVIITNASITDHDEVCLHLIRAMNEKQIAAIAINVGQITDPVRDYCNQAQLPLFELKMSLHLIDLSQILCEKLYAEENLQTSKERILAQILEAESVDRERITKEAAYMGVTLQNGQYSVAVFHMEGAPAGGPASQSLQYLKQEVYMRLQPYLGKNYLMMETIDSVVVLLPQDVFTDARVQIKDVCGKICEAASSAAGVEVYCGIGLPYEYMEEFRNSYHEALDCLRADDLYRKHHVRVYYYEDLGIYSVILKINDGKFLDEYVDACLGKLLAVDDGTDASYFHTLEVYLECNANANEAAKALFIHRNTMLYRLQKIKGILNVDLSDLSTLLELKTAYDFYHYRHADQR